MRFTHHDNVNRAIIVLLATLVLVNTVVLLRSFDFFNFPGETSSLEMVKEGTQTMIDSIQKFAEEMGVWDSNVVRNSVARFKYEIGLSPTTEALAQVVMRNSRQVQEVIMREAENMRNQLILGIIGQEPHLSLVKGKASIVLSKESGHDILIDDKSNVLSDATITKLTLAKELQDSFAEIVIEVEDGSPKILNSRRLYERLAFLEGEVARLQSHLVEAETQAGYRTMSGEGLVVKVYDAEGGVYAEEIVHDIDIRDILNELWSAGALGASVGGRRVVNTTSIRCVGPVILVNHQPIAVDPVTINVVGNPSVLASSLEIIKNTLGLSKGIEITVETSEDIVLPAYEKVPQ